MDGKEKEGGRGNRCLIIVCGFEMIIKTVIL